MKKASNKNTIKWIFKRSKKYLPFVFINSLNSAIIAVSFIVLALFSKDVLDIATGAKQGSMVFYSIALLITVLIQIFLSGVSSYLKNYSLGKLTIEYRNHLFSTLTKKKYSEIRTFHSGDFLNRFTSDTDVVISSVVNIIPNIVSMITKIIAGVGTLLILNWTVAIIVLVLGLTFPAIGRFLNKKYKYMHKECQKTEGQARSFLQECFENIVVIKTFISEIPFLNKLNTYMNKNFKMKIKRTMISICASLGLYAFFTIGYYAILLWGANCLKTGAMTFGTLTAFLQLVAQLQSPLQNVSGILPQYYSSIASAERLIEIENFTDEKSTVDDEKLSKLKENFSSIQVNNITFGYDSEIILKDCTFEIESNKITAITGESGSGKSTLFKIMLGLFEPQNGNITANNDTVIDSSVRGLFAYVPQGNLVLSGTIKENITLCDNTISEEKIINAAKVAEIYDYIKTLPDGLNTVLSERGAGLSEGQIQRISIARAILVDSPIILLDEATSALDEQTETKVLSNIKKMTDKTILFITHRNTSLKVCDKIIRVIDKKFTTIK